MPRHHRNASGAHHHYANPLPDAMASTSLYAQQPQRMQLPSNYYAVPPAPDADSLRFSDPQQASFEACARIPSTLPPSTQHRPSSGAWTVQDDNQLITARMQGLNWSQIKDAYFPAKSANACRKRHERLMERRGTDDWDTRKLQHLAKEYMSMRKEIWSGLAARTGEKWNVVEAKCMSNGLKNLQSAARAASRRDRLETGTHMTGYDDDSGISGTGLTPVDDLEASYSSPEMGSSIGAAHSFSSSSAASGFNYHIPGHAAAQNHLRPQINDQPSYTTYGTSYGSHHEVSSSLSSMATRSGQQHHSRGNSPYIDGQRLTNADLGDYGSIQSSSRKRL